MHYPDFFRAATSTPTEHPGPEPLGYQQRYHHSRALNSVLSIPTGLGKTDAVLVDWLFRLRYGGALRTRRLAWVLPGRALAEQVAAAAKRLVANVHADVRVCLLMGGSGDNDLTIGPDEAAIFVGTQDLLMSRALNRGYARNIFRWPIDFALLNNDTTWVLDEVQLLGESLATSAQLAAFRERFGTFGTCPSVWLSATMRREWLETFDFAESAREARVFGITNEEVVAEDVTRQRLHAVKQVGAAPAECRLPGGCAAFALKEHRGGTLTLVVVNTVERARDIYEALDSAKREAGSPETILLHSRFRPADRRSHLERLLSDLPAEGRIVVSTQVIEAGIDISAALMISDAAPYASMTQRFGRVNRKGELPDSRVYWVDFPLTARRKAWRDRAEFKPKELDEVYGPYDARDVENSVATLRTLHSAAPADLPPLAASTPPWKHVLRRSDLFDLFDTTPDLSGNQIDISRFVRSGEDTNVYVAWRRAPESQQGAEIKDDELCPTPIGELRKFAEKKTAWRWDAIEEEWRPFGKDDPLYPGLTVVFDVKDGGYTSATGWHPGSREPVSDISDGIPANAAGSDRLSFARKRQTLVEHTDEVVDEMRNLLDVLTDVGLGEFRPALELAARKHDWGKAHRIMQETLQGGTPAPGVFLGKSDDGKRKHSRKYFRHELASALAMLQGGDPDLCAYIAVAHHGRIRMGIRSMAGERDAGKEFTRGIAAGDELPECELGGGLSCARVTLRLDPIWMGGDAGGRSWADRTIALRDELGPFRLAYLEMLLRIADERASARVGAVQ